MPVMFPEYDPTDPNADPLTGLVDRPFLEIAEVATLLHVSERTVRDRVKSGEWPSVQIVTGRIYLRPQQVSDIVAMGTHDNPVAPPVLPPPTIGTPVSDADTEGVR